MSLGALALVSALAASPAPPASGPPDLKQYQFVLLWAGPNRGGKPDEIERVQKGHMANIERLAKAGKLVIAGPFDGNGKLRGVFILDVPTRAEAEALVATDPAVKAGRLKPEILSWWTKRGATLP